MMVNNINCGGNVMEEKENNNDNIQEENRNNEQKDNKEKMQEENNIQDNKKDEKNEKLSPEMQKMQEELDNTTDRLKRIMAEFDNFKKRNAKEREMLYSSILGDIVCKLLPVLDNLEKAESAETTDANYKQGIDLVLKQYVDVLSSFGVTQIESVGQTFDPELHEAVSMVQDDTLGEKEIKEEFRKGYKLRR